MPERRARKVTLTQKLVEGLEHPPTGREYVYDDAVRALAICVTAAGVKSWYWIGRIKSLPTRLCLGRFPEVPVARARREAQRISGEVADGKMPTPRRRGGPQSLTLGMLFSEWLAKVSRPHKRTWETDRKRFDRVLHQWRNRTLAQITTEEVRDHHIALGESAGRFAANKMLELLRTLYNYAADVKGWSGRIPTRGIKRFHTVERDRFLSQDELARFFAAIETIHRQTAKDFLLLCLFTGARRSNVMTMRWDQLDLESRVWRVPPSRAKSKEPMQIPLTAAAVEILRRRQASRQSEWVLPGRGPLGHYACPKDAWNRVIKAAGLKDVRLHDLRRTLGSYQAMAGASLPIIARSLGHESLAATGIYARLALDPVRESMDTAVAAMQSAAQQNPESAKNP